LSNYAAANEEIAETLYGDDYSLTSKANNSVPKMSGDAPWDEAIAIAGAGLVALGIVDKLLVSLFQRACLEVAEAKVQKKGIYTKIEK
jgi:hypothetical protein